MRMPTLTTVGVYTPFTGRDDHICLISAGKGNAQRTIIGGLPQGLPASHHLAPQNLHERNDIDDTELRAQGLAIGFQ